MNEADEGNATLTPLDDNAIQRFSIGRIGSSGSATRAVVMKFRHDAIFVAAENAACFRNRQCCSDSSQHRFCQIVGVLLVICDFCRHLKTCATFRQARTKLYPT